MGMKHFNPTTPSLRNMTVSTYDEITKTTPEKSLLAKKKKLEPSDKEYEKKVEEYAEKAGYEDVDAFRKAYDEDTIRATILQEAVANYLLESSVQVEAANTDNSTDGSSSDTTNK